MKRMAGDGSILGDSPFGIVCELITACPDCFSCLIGEWNVYLDG
jgi:hypothetical protein